MHAGDCRERRHVACQDVDGGFHVTDKLATWDQARKRCRPEYPASDFAVPTNGYDAASLDGQRPEPGATVWVAYRDVAGQWRAATDA